MSDECPQQGKEKIGEVKVVEQDENSQQFRPIPLEEIEIFGFLGKAFNPQVR